MTLLHFADSKEAADLAAFLGRLLRYDKRAAVRIQAHGQALAVFGHPPFGVLAVRTARLDPRAAEKPPLDVTVSAGQFLDGFDEAAAAATVPPAVTGPPWAGLLPPRGGWHRTAELPAEQVRREVAQGIAEFRARSEELAPEQRTRTELDRIADEIWSRPLALAGAPSVPLRAAHAAYALGFLPSPRRRGGPERPGAGAGDRIVVLSNGGWLRMRTDYGSVAVRRTAGFSLAVTPVS